jgi:hypothetical protein
LIDCQVHNALHFDRFGGKKAIIFDRRECSLLFRPGLVGRLFLVTTELRLLPYPDQGHTLCRVMFLSENGRFLGANFAHSRTMRIPANVNAHSG